MTDEIRTQRLVMRRFRMDDVAPMHRMLSDPEATRYWSTPPHESLEQSEAWVRSEVESSPELIDDFVVTLDGSVIGKLGCFRLPEIGYLFDPSTWGRGYATEALTAFIDHRRRQGGTELTADVDPRNSQSMRLLTRCGFKETHRATATWEIGGEWHDSVYLRVDLTRR